MFNRMQTLGDKDRAVRRRTVRAVVAGLVMGALVVTSAPGATADDGGGQHPDVKVEHNPHANRGTLVKGEAYTHVFTLSNRTRKKRQVWVTVGGQCYAAGDAVYWTSWQRRVTVPRMTAKGWQTQARNRVKSLKVKVAFPDKCFDGTQIGEYFGEARVRVTKRRPTVASGVAASAQLFSAHPVTRANARKNLEALALPPRGGVSKQKLHRMFPAKHAAKFARVGLKVDDPRWTRWWCNVKGDKNKFTKKKLRAYNARWNSFFKKNPKPGMHKILEHRRRVAHDWDPKMFCRL